MLSLDLKKTKRSFTLAATAVFCSLLIGFVFKDHVQPAITIVDDTPLVRTMMVSSADGVQSYSYSGEVRGRRESQLAFQVGGKIIKRHVELGSMVKPGQTLMQIDPKDIREIVGSRIAQVAEAKSRLQLAESDLKRYGQLYEQDIICSAELDRYQSAYEVAQAAHQQAKAQYVQVSNQLKYSSLRADHSGVVSGISAEVGQVVSPGQIVITLVKEGEREVEINVPENRIQEIGNASQVKITFWALPDLMVAGKIREIAPMADAISRTYKVRVGLLKQSPKIRLGMTATVNIAVTDDQNIIAAIPLSALYQTKETPCVWIVQEGKVRLRPIKTGAFGNGRIQVTAGLKTGETIVTAGVHKLREGREVNTLGVENNETL